MNTMLDEKRTDTGTPEALSNGWATEKQLASMAHVSNGAMHQWILKHKSELVRRFVGVQYLI